MSIAAAVLYFCKPGRYSRRLFHTGEGDLPVPFASLSDPPETASYNMCPFKKTYRRKESHMKKRILSLLLTLVMVISLIPTTAWAADTTVNATVNIVAQAGGGFVIAPQYNVTVNSGLAESYGYTDDIDKATNVSALDVLVKAHELIFEDYVTAENKTDYLAVAESTYGGSYVTTIFGTLTANNGFALNGTCPNDGTASSFGGYTGTTLSTQKVVTNDTLDFFVYQDTSCYDYLSWFCDADGKYISSLSTTAGQSLTLMVKGIGYMSGYLYKDATATHDAGSAINNAKLAWVDADTGVLAKTAITATTDSTGKVTFTAPATAGTYYLTAYTDGEGATPLIMAVLPITVATGTTGGTETGTGTDTPDTPPAPAAETLSSLTLYTSQSGMSTHTLTPAFDPDVKTYSITVADNASTTNVFAAATPTTEGSKVKISWTNLGTSETSTQEMSAAARTKLTNCTKKGATGNTVTLTVGEGTSADTYTVTVKRSPTLKALSITDVPLKEAFKATITTYTAETTADSVTFNATGSYDGYTFTYNGSDSSTVALPTIGENIVTVKVTNPDGGLSNDYTVKITRKAQTGVTFTVPDGASLVVYDASGRVIAPTSGTTYPLAVDDEYTYTVAKAGCKSFKGTYTPTNDASQTVPVTLETAGTAGSHDEVVAAWKNFRNNDVNMGITNKQTPVSAETAVLKWSKKIGEPGSASNNWKGTDPSAQIIVDNSLIVMSGTTLYKLSLDDGHVVTQATMDKAPSMGSYIPPTYADGLILCPLDGGTIQAFDAKTLASVWVYTDPAGGQAQSPITCSGGYAYTGFYNGEMKSANYVCLSLTDEDSTKTDEDKYATWSKSVTGGFYWAGSVVVGNALIVGSDDGAPEGTNGTSYLYALDKTTGNEINKLALTGLGDQRSSIAYDSDTGRVYFTTKSGHLCSAAVAADGNLSDLKQIQLSTHSTSTPIVYDGYVYVGAGPYNNAKFFVCNASDLSIHSSVAMKAQPQGSPLLSTAYESSGYLYFYCTYNRTPGGISLIKVDTTTHQATLTELFTPDESMQQYCIASIICDTDGTLYYKNDSCYVFAVKTDTDALNAAAAVTAKINAIGTVTLESESAITAARSAYDALTDAQKALVNSDTLATLTTAETTLADLKAAADRAAADAVIAKINAVTAAIADGDKDDIKSAINDAMTAYNALTAAQKALVTNYDVLTAADSKYNSTGSKHEPVRRQPSATGTTTGSGSTGGSTTNTRDDVKSPTTGDGSHMLLWLSGTLLSAAAIAVLTTKKKRSAR